MELKQVIVQRTSLWNLTLLIVPYGIETCLSEALISISFAFNRTLWN